VATFKEKLIMNSSKSITMKKKHLTYYCLYLCALLNIFCNKSTSQNTEWTHFRGSDLNGISTETGIPVKWDETTAIAWKTPIHGRGWSSPVVLGNQIWMTTANEDGTSMDGVCVDKNSGKVIYNIELLKPDSIDGKHALNSYATPTPCIEEGFVYLDFGSYGTFCVNTTNGSLVWKRTDFKCEHVQGPGSSPIIYKELLILHYEGTDVQFIVALNKKTGELVWKKERPQEYYVPLLPIGKKAYITPLIITVNGKDQLISNGAAVCIAYDPLTGEEIWRIVQGEDSTIAMPIFENGTLYFYTSFISPPEGEKYAELIAVNPDGKGDITKTNIKWRFKAPILQLLTPLIKDGLIYTVDTKSNLICIDAKTGAQVWTEKLKGTYNASPVYADGNLYFASTKGDILVIKAGRKFEKVAENKLTGEIWATPAIVNKSIIIRTSEFLYKISD